MCSWHIRGQVTMGHVWWLNFPATEKDDFVVMRLERFTGKRKWAEHSGDCFWISTQRKTHPSTYCSDLVKQPLWCSDWHIVKNKQVLLQYVCFDVPHVLGWKGRKGLWDILPGLASWPAAVLYWWSLTPVCLESQCPCPEETCGWRGLQSRREKNHVPRHSIRDMEYVRSFYRVTHNTQQHHVSKHIKQTQSWAF